MAINKQALAAYRDALDELTFTSPLLGTLAQRMGHPIWDEDQPTAYVTMDEDRVAFAFNPDFILTLTPEQAAAVLGHEASHILLNHLAEMRDQATYPNQAALINAHECIINDNLENRYSMELIPNVLRGPELIGQDLSAYSTPPAYALFDNKTDEDDKGDGEGEVGDEDSDGNGQGSSQGAPSDGASGQGNPSAGEQDSAEAGSGGPSNDPSMPEGKCGGIVANDVDLDKLEKAMEAVVSGTAQDMGVTKDELQDMFEGIDAGAGYSPTGAPVADSIAISNERMNWRSLLAKINPKILESGTPKRRYRNDWTRYNRRMGSVYPNVILPTSRVVQPKKADDDGDSLPVFVIALDLSGSIDRSLVGMLKGLLKDIPEELVKAYPCTWATRLTPFTEANNWRTESGGTYIHHVSNYVEKVARETGTEPYVLVITDGEFNRGFDRPGKEWFFMGVNNSSVDYIKRLHARGEEVYNVRDFRA